MSGKPRVEVRESRKIIWHSNPVDKGDSVLRSADKRWAIIQGSEHHTLLEHGAAVFRCASQDQAIEEAARRAGL